MLPSLRWFRWLRWLRWSERLRWLRWLRWLDGFDGFDAFDSPQGTPGDTQGATRGTFFFVTSHNCNTCHHVFIAVWYLALIRNMEMTL